MTIKHTDTIKSVQEQFSTSYPYLKLQFYKKPHKDHDGSLKKDEVNGDVNISELSGKTDDVTVSIESSVSVSELESTFEERAGLHVQVFRKSGDAWLQTSATDHWSLAKHQERAAEAEGMEHSNE